MFFFGYFWFSLCFCINANEYAPFDHRFSSIFNETDNTEINYRLPNNTKPESYDIKLSTNIHEGDFNFSGLAAINLRVLEPSYNITLHARQLTIKSIQLTTSFGIKIDTHNFTYDPVTEFLTIPTTSQLQKNAQYQLAIAYSGTLRTDNLGFYRSSYINSKGETRLVQS